MNIKLNLFDVDIISGFSQIVRIANNLKGNTIIFLLYIASCPVTSVDVSVCFTADGTPEENS